VDVFLQNTAVGDVMFGGLNNFKKSYDYGDIPLVYMPDIIHTKTLASILSNSSLQHSNYELMLNDIECPKSLRAIRTQTCGKHIYYAPRLYQIYIICLQASNCPAYHLKEPFYSRISLCIPQMFCWDVISYLAKGY
jgi:hypothetical protein